MACTSKTATSSPSGFSPSLTGSAAPSCRLRTRESVNRFRSSQSNLSAKRNTIVVKNKNMKSLLNVQCVSQSACFSPLTWASCTKCGCPISTQLAKIQTSPAGRLAVRSLIWYSELYMLKVLDADCWRCGWCTSDSRNALRCAHIGNVLKYTPFPIIPLTPLLDA